MVITWQVDKIVLKDDKLSYVQEGAGSAGLGGEVSEGGLLRGGSTPEYFHL